MHCPECNQEFEPTNRALSHLECPSCGATISIFSEDTYVPNMPREADSGSIPELRIDGYEVGEVLGSGGMGIVLEGRQISLGRRVAFKILRPSMAADKQLVERFDREATALAHLAHPNIVTIFEKGKSDDLVYFIMEYVEGADGGPPTDLRNLLEKGRLAPAEVKYYILQVARALEYAHARGIVHRDVKPANVMVDRHNNAKVADFGIASVLGDQHDAQLTAPASSLGTLDYMAPEQHEGRKCIDHRADIYSLGVMLYQLLTSTLPRGAFQSPSKLIRGLDPRWDGIIAKMMQNDAADRYSSMGEVIQEIERVDVSRNEFESQSESGETATSTVHDQPSGNTKSGAKVCPECRVPVPDNAKYCPQCRTPQQLTCSDCGETVQAGVSYCPNCGRDVQQYRQELKYLEISARELEQANDEQRTLTQRCEAAQQASLAASRAVKYGPKSQVARESLERANRCELKLASQAGAAAWKDRRLDEAQAYFEQVLSIKPDDAKTAQGLAEIKKLYDETLQRAASKFGEGAIQQAIAMLEKLQQRFPSSQQLESLLTQYRQQHEQVGDMVRRVIPQLSEQKQWLAVEKQLTQLQESGINVRGMAELAESVRVRKQLIAPLVQEMESLFEQGQISEAAARANKILDRVADHPRALEISKLHQRTRAEAQLLVDQLRNASEQQRWIAADLTLQKMSVEERKRLSPQTAAAVASGRTFADNYLQLLLIAGGGIAVTIAAYFLAQLFTAGISELISGRYRGPLIFQSTALQELTLLGSFIVIFLVGIGLLRVALARPMAIGRSVFLCLSGMLGAFAYVAVLVYLPKYVDSDWITILATSCLFAGLWGCLMMATSFDLMNPPKPAFLAANFLGAVIGLGFAANEKLDLQSTRYLVPALWLLATLLIVRQVKPQLRALLLPLAGMLVGVLSIGADRLNWDWGDMTKSIAAALLLAVAAMAASARIRPSSITFAALTSLVIVWGTEQLVASRLLLWITLWLVVPTTLAFLSASQIDARLHLSDRLLAWRQKTPPNSTS